MTPTAVRRNRCPYVVAAAIGWVVLGVVVDLGTTWGIFAVTLAFGASTAGLVPKLVASLDTVDHHGDAVAAFARIYGYLAVLAAGTVLLGFVLHADGAEHPAIFASIFAALLLVTTGLRVAAGGPPRR